MSEQMTAEQAWAEVDRLDKESDAAILECERLSCAKRTARKCADRLVGAYCRAIDAAEAIGPRPVKVPS